jgi:hypothetical protein
MKTFIFLSELSDRKHIKLDAIEKFKLVCFAIAYPVVMVIAATEYIC